MADIDNVSEDTNKSIIDDINKEGLNFHMYILPTGRWCFSCYMTITADIAGDEEERRLRRNYKSKDDLTITCARQRMLW